MERPRKVQNESHSLFSIKHFNVICLETWVVVIFLFVFFNFFLFSFFPFFFFVGFFLLFFLFFWLGTGLIYFILLTCLGDIVKVYVFI